ncbi:MAG TPA: hypothetical protein VGB91_17295 [Rhizomicrobium sp.]
MPVTPTEAASTLRDIQRTSQASGQALGYRNGGPYLILWGLVWMVGYAGSDLAPAHTGEIWLGAVLVGAIGSTIMGRLRPSRSQAARSAGKMFALVAIIFLYIVAMNVVMWPSSPRQQAVIAPLLAGAVYAAAGLFGGVRWIVAGAAIAALTLGGYFYVHEHFGLWMALVGGGGLILAGLWMRSA